MDIEPSNSEENLPEQIPRQQVMVVRFSNPVVALLLILSCGFPAFLIFYALAYLQSTLDKGLFHLLAGYICGLCLYVSIFPKNWLLRSILTVIYTIAFLQIFIPTIMGIGAS